MKDNLEYPLHSIQFNFICIALLTKGLCHKAALQRTGPQWVSLGQQWQGKTPWQITGRNLEQNPTQRGNHLPLVGTGFNPNVFSPCKDDSGHVEMVTVAGRVCPAGIGWISGPGGGGQGTWARASAWSREIFMGFRCWSSRAGKTEVPACDKETPAE